MLHYLLKRLFFMVPMLFGITLISFAVIHLAPGEPDIVGAEMNPKVTKEVRERIQKYLWPGQTHPRTVLDVV